MNNCQVGSGKMGDPIPEGIASRIVEAVKT